MGAMPTARRGHVFRCESRMPTETSGHGTRHLLVDAPLPGLWHHAGEDGSPPLASQHMPQGRFQLGMAERVARFFEPARHDADTRQQQLVGHFA
jgi:hypothetical protein